MAGWNRFACLLAIGLCCSALLACETPFEDAGAAARCGPPRFPYHEGWLGGDAAYSVPISGRRSAWLFGDSFVGAPGAPDRRGSAFIHNSVAVAECGRDGSWKVDYAWRRGASGAAAAFFEPDDDDYYWWLFDGFMHGGKLYVGLLMVEESEPHGALQLPFRFRGVELARVENPEAPPQSWHFEVLPLSEDPRALPASSMVVHADYVYLFTFLVREDERLPRMLARFPTSALDQDPPRPGQALEYLASSNEWKPGLDPEDALVLMQDDASEMSVRFHPSIARWVAVYGYPTLTEDFPHTAPSDRIYLRTAREIAGPWSAPRTIFRIPELSDDHVAGKDPNTFCYAGKEHPTLAREGRLLLTYVCNLFTPVGQDPGAVLGRLLARMDLYRPQAVSIPFPALEAEAASP